MKFKRLMAMVMAVSLIVAFMPAFASAAPGGEEANANSTVTIRGTKALSAAAQFTVKEGLTSLNGYPVTYGDQYGERSIIVDLGTYNVNNQSFRIPGVDEIFNVQTGTACSYVMTNHGERSPGASVLLQNGGKELIYYFSGGSTPTPPPVQETYTVNFHKNTQDNVANMPAQITAEAGSQVTLPDNIPLREDWVFIAWNNQVQGANYQPGQTITMPNGNITLYAIWEPDVNHNGIPDGQESPINIDWRLTGLTYQDFEYYLPPSARSNQVPLPCYDVAFTLVPYEGYVLPEELNIFTLVGGGTTLVEGEGYTYDNTTGEVVLFNVIADLTITANGVPVGFRDGHTEVIGQAPVDYVVVIPYSVDFGSISRNDGELEREFWIKLESALIDYDAVINVSLGDADIDTRINTMTMYDKDGAGIRELGFDLLNGDDEQVTPGATYCTFTYDDVSGDENLTSQKDGTVTCDAGELRAAGAYRGYMMFEVTYNGTDANSHIEIDPDAMP